MGDANIPSLVTEIKSKIDIVNYIGQVIELKKAGRVYKGICPFHPDTDPSFTVYPHQKNPRYKCFGCDKAGDLITFEMEYYKKDFLSAVTHLAAKAGIDVSEIKSEEYKEKQKLYEVLTEATDFFVDQLQNKRKHLLDEFIKERKVSTGAVQSARIGFSPNNTELLDYLKNKGFTESELLLSGLFKKHDNQIFPHFKNYITLPVIHNGKTTYFIGRMTGETPNQSKAIKYLNLPSKSNDFSYVSQFVERARFWNEDAMCDSDRVFITESVIDGLIGMDRGFPFIAFGGKNIPDKSLGRLHDLCHDKKTYIVFDKEDNEAGTQAALKLADTLFVNYGKIVNIITFPNDPTLSKIDLDIFFRVNTNQSFEDLVTNSLDYVEYLIDKSSCSIESARSVLRKIQELSPLEQSNYLKSLQKKTGFNKTDLQNELLEITAKEQSLTVKCCLDIKRILERNLKFISSKGSSVQIYNKKINEVETLSSSRGNPLFDLSIEDREGVMQKYPTLFKGTRGNIASQKRAVKELVEDVFVEESRTLPVMCPYISDGINIIKDEERRRTDTYFGFRNKVFVLNNNEWREQDLDILNISEMDYNDENGDINDIYASSHEEVYKSIYSLLEYWRFRNDRVTKHLITALILYFPIWAMFDFPLLMHITGASNTGKSKLARFMHTLAINSIRVGPDSTDAGIRDWIGNRKLVVFMDEAKDADNNSLLQKRQNARMVNIRSSLDGAASRLRSNPHHKASDFGINLPWVFSSINPMEGTQNINRTISLETAYKGVKNYNPFNMALADIKKISQYRIYIAGCLIPHLKKIETIYNDMKYNLVTAESNRENEIMAVPLAIVKLCAPNDFDDVFRGIQKISSEKTDGVSSFQEHEAIYDIIINTRNKTPGTAYHNHTIEEFWNSGKMFYNEKKYEIFDDGAGVTMREGKLYILLSVFKEYVRPRLQDYSAHQIHSILESVGFMSKKTMQIKSSRYYELFRRTEGGDS